MCLTEDKGSFNYGWDLMGPLLYSLVAEYDTKEARFGKQRFSITTKIETRGDAPKQSCLYSRIIYFVLDIVLDFPSHII